MAGSLVGRSVGNFVLVEKIGAGGMGEVYLARHDRIGKKVAVKVLHGDLAYDEEMLGRFFQEAKAVNDIGHPNIVDVIDYGAADDLVYITMEYLEGETLARRLETVGVTLDESRRILETCCAALAASHAHGIVHRDLKPENVFLCRRGGERNFVKLLDFGIAKLMRREGKVVETAKGQIFGTPEYMSPEQAAGADAIDARSDVYALGVMLFELATGRLPFDRGGASENILAHLTEAPPRPSSINPYVPPAIEAIILKALAKDPRRRFQSVEELGQALGDPPAYWSSAEPLPDPLRDEGRERFTAKAPGRSFSTTVKVRRGLDFSTVKNVPPRSNGPWLVAGLAILLAAAALGVALSRGSAPPSAPPPSPKPAATERVRVQVDATPPGATVRGEDGRLYGTTPIAFEVARSARPLVLEIAAPGYEPLSRTLFLDRDQALDVALEKRAPAAAAPPPRQIHGKQAAQAAPRPPPRAEAPAPRPPAGDDSDLHLLQPKSFDPQ